MGIGKSPKKNLGRNVLIIAILITVLFAFKNRLASTFKFADGMTQAVNFRLAKMKGMLYKQTLKFKSRVNDISYIDEYVEKNKTRDFELQKNKVQNMELANLKIENEKLRQMLEMRTKQPSEYIAADIALVENGSSSDTIYINKGKNQGLSLNLPVMYDGYLIGKISKINDEYSEVMLLTSKKSRMSVVVNGTDMQILRGNGNGTFSILNYNENVNDKTVFNIETSGVSDIFPRGIKIGAFKIRDINAFKKMKEIKARKRYSTMAVIAALTLSGPFFAIMFGGTF